MRQLLAPLVENRPGGGTVIGTEYVARQPGDGHTILCIGPSFTMLHALRSKVPFETARDFRASIRRPARRSNSPRF